MGYFVAHFVSAEDTNGNTLTKNATATTIINLFFICNLPISIIHETPPRKGLAYLTDIMRRKLPKDNFPLLPHFVEPLQAFFYNFFTNQPASSPFPNIA
jgi:hypothetical protein